MEERLIPASKKLRAAVFAVGFALLFGILVGIVPVDPEAVEAVGSASPPEAPADDAS